MKTIIGKLVTTTLLTALSMSAFAQGAAPTEAERDNANLHSLNQYPVVPFSASKTRAEVKAELVAAQHAGTIANGDSYPILPQAQSHKTRAQVRQELVQAQREGSIANGDDYPIIKPATTHKTRAEVKAELAAARQASSGGSLYQGY